MIDSVVDRLYRPIRISNRMRLAKLLLLLLLEEDGCDPSIHILSYIRFLYRQATSQAAKRNDTNVIRVATAFRRFHMMAAVLLPISYVIRFHKM